MERTIGSLVDKAAALFTDRPWLHYDGEVTTFGDLKERSDSAAAELLKLGVTRGDRVVFCAPQQSRSHLPVARGEQGWGCVRAAESSRTGE